MRQRALLAWRSPPLLRRCRMVCPEDAWTGLAPHRAAKDDSVFIRSGLSPAVTSNAEARVRADSRSSEQRRVGLGASMSHLCGERRHPLFPAAQTLSGLGWKARTVWTCVERRPPPERRATRSILIDSTGPSPVLGWAVASPLRTARAAAMASTVSGFAQPAAQRPVGPVHLQDLNIHLGQVAGQPGAVTAVPSTPTRARPQPVEMLVAGWSDGNGAVPKTRPAGQPT